MNPRRAAFALSLFALIACDKREATPAPAPSSSVPLPLASASASSAASVVSSAAPERPILATEGCGKPLPIAIRSAKSIGHTSVVFKLELESNAKMAWKPSSRRGKDRWRGEIAAAKLGDALAIPNVPPACMRTFTRADLEPHLPKGALDEVISYEEGVNLIDGAMIPWIEGLRFMELGKDAGATPDVAAQLSTLVVFDAITGNWDRYSGGNVGLDASGTRVLFIDNDAAFMEGAPPKDLAANVARVESTQKFSRSLVKRLRTLDVPKAFGTLPDGAPLLSPGMQKSVSERIANVLKIIDAKIAARSENDVLTFP